MGQGGAIRKECGARWIEPDGMSSLSHRRILVLRMKDKNQHAQDPKLLEASLDGLKHPELQEKLQALVKEEQKLSEEKESLQDQLRDFSNAIKAREGFKAEVKKAERTLEQLQEAATGLHNSLSGALSIGEKS